MRLDLSAVVGCDPTVIRDQPRDAAVLAPVIERDDGHSLLFIKRSEDLGEHPGQMSFPGGGAEPEDVDLQATAIREADEEIGLDPEEARILGRLDAIRTVTDYAVSPFVGMVPDREYAPDGVEAIEVAILSVADLTDPANYEFETRDHPTYGEVVVHYFHVDGYTVWGATGRILVDLLELTTDWRAPVRSRSDVG
ncbi:Mut/nudix family protein [Salinarchaeum sp. Harcht-Bsk1]|uniref:NUDIX hydrolase n=1 Tax=Salinarchaeum sp. Harcht-Bsk1 TaxID=1333523 RepID=UPI000342477D|nr:CoA pyrophosphatase [Salinarchaeum sp. Harcht-Bsk1]AGN02506.1 Mut/nudix family protein [Salinarchaeum sp. Harcht-Bsk1]